MAQRFVLGHVFESDAMATKKRLLTTMREVCCSTPLQAPDLSDDDADALARRFAALGDPIRVRLLNLVANGPAEGVCVCDLCDPVGRSQPTVSHHLKLLKDAGLVESERRGTWQYYRAVPATLASLRDSLR